MEYIRNHFLSSNKNNIELCDLESGSSNSQMGVALGARPTNTSIYPTLPQPVLSSTYPTQLAVPNYSRSFPMSDAASNIHAMVSTDSMQIETSGGSLQLLSLAEVEMQSNTNQKRSGHQDQANSTSHLSVFGIIVISHQYP